MAVRVLRELLHSGLIEFWARTSDRENGLITEFYDSSRVFYTFTFDSPNTAAATPVSLQSETHVQTTTTITKSIVFQPSHTSVIKRVKADGSLKDKFTRALCSGGGYRPREQSFNLPVGRQETMDESVSLPPMFRSRAVSFRTDIPQRYVRHRHCHSYLKSRWHTICNADN